MKKLILAVSALLGMVYARIFGGSMDGTVWDVKIRPDSFFSLPYRDKLIFDKGHLTAAASIAEGFTPAAYSAQELSGDLETVWNASLTHFEKGVMTWHGLVRGDHIEGVAVWWVRNGRPRRFLFSGKRKNA